MDDLIRRKDAIDAVRGRFSMPVDNLIVEVIGNLPSAQPERKKGHWELFAESSEAMWDCKCSVCGSIKRTLQRHHYCPNCGAKMDEGEEE